MNLEEVQELWSKDCRIDETNLVGEAARIPVLHEKYYMRYVKESLRAQKLRADLIKLEKDKHEYYAGTMSKEDLAERGWEPFRLKVMKSDMSKYINSDNDIVELGLRIAYVESIAKFLEDIVRQINNRNFIITNMAKVMMFQQGVNY